MSKISRTVFGFLFITAFVSMIVTRQYFTRARPEAPRPDLGWTIPASVNYGKTVYVSPGEEKILNLTGEWTFVALFAVGGVVYLVTQKRKVMQSNQ